MNVLTPPKADWTVGGKSSALPYQQALVQRSQAVNQLPDSCVVGRHLNQNKVRKIGVIISLDHNSKANDQMIKMELKNKNNINEKIVIEFSDLFEYSQNNWKYFVKISKFNDDIFIEKIRDTEINADYPFEAMILLLDCVRKTLDQHGVFEADGNPIWCVVPRTVPYGYGETLVKEIEKFIDSKVDQWNRDVEKRLGLSHED